jgi:hypothetical protein
MLDKRKHLQTRSGENSYSTLEGNLCICVPAYCGGVGGEGEIENSRGE